MRPIQFESAFGTYIATEQLGEGGSGVVYGGLGPGKIEVAIKALRADRVSSDKRKRFKNEVAFLTKTEHRHIVAVIDYGLDLTTSEPRPFFVMPRYTGSLRQCIEGGLAPRDAMHLFSQLLDGVEAAHLKKVIHRDLKPENVLFDKKTNAVAVADFGIARFNEDLLITAVQTQARQRLANFQYAAPEQRTPEETVGIPADIYALGLILNEMFTGRVPHGTEFRKISDVYSDYGFLDPIVSMMIMQDPKRRPESIAALKGLIQRYSAESVGLQKISKIDNTVIPVGAIDDPLAFEPPRLINADWADGQLTLTLDRPVSKEWISAMCNLGNYTSVPGAAPTQFRFRGNIATVHTASHSAQSVIDCFKGWLPRASSVLMSTLQRQAELERRERIQRLDRERKAEEERLNVNKNLRV